MAHLLFVLFTFVLYVFFFLLLLPFAYMAVVIVAFWPTITSFACWLAGCVLMWLTNPTGLVVFTWLIIPGTGICFGDRLGCLLCATGAMILVMSVIARLLDCSVHGDHCIMIGRYILRAWENTMVVAWGAIMVLPATRTHAWSVHWVLNMASDAMVANLVAFWGFKPLGEQERLLPFRILGAAFIKYGYEICQILMRKEERLYAEEIDRPVENVFFKNLGDAMLVCLTTWHPCLPSGRARELLLMRWISRMIMFAKAYDVWALCSNEYAMYRKHMKLLKLIGRTSRILYRPQIRHTIREMKIAFTRWKAHEEEIEKLNLALLFSQSISINTRCARRFWLHSDSGSDL
jgi:hypothetical protein